MASKKLKNLSPDAIWARWNERMERVRRELHYVFLTRKKFRDVTWMFENNPTLKATGGSVYEWLFLMWARDIVIAIRRELDHDTNTVCLSRLLDEFVQRPQVITRGRYTERVPRDNFMFEVLNGMFDGYGCQKPDPSDPTKDYLDQQGIAHDRKQLLTITKPVLAYANQLIAHRSETEKLPITVGDINRALDAVETTFLKYYAIVNGPAVTGLEPSMIGDWMEPFQIPWLTPKASPDEV